MNKKIFTLLVGAIMLIGSVFTVNAQPPMPYPTLPYSYKDATAGQTTNFRDVLTADVVDKLPGVDGKYFLLSVTGIANPTIGTEVAVLAGRLSGLTSVNNPIHDLVLSIDNTSATQRYLRLEELWKLDHAYAYVYNRSHKFGALRSALWCAHYDAGVIGGSNLLYDFNQMTTGLALQSPLLSDNPALWTLDADGSMIYKDGTMGINTFDDDLIVNGWHFSQVVSSTQKLQKNMPMYSYVTPDSVVVLALERDVEYVYPENVPSGDPEDALSGGWKVTVKYVSVYDLIDVSTTNGDVWPGPAVPGGRKCIENVLLFTLKKVNPFVMSADDWNAVNNTITFNPDANTQVTNQEHLNKYTNPFTDEVFNPLFAAEVNDSLYHFGYMNFQNTAAVGKDPNAQKWLYVDTAWVNYGNNQYLAFGWDERRDNAQNVWTSPEAMLWGDSFVPCTGVDQKLYTAGGDDYITADYSTAGYLFWRFDSIVWAFWDMILENAQDQLSDPTLTMDDFIYNNNVDRGFVNITGANINFTITTDFSALYTEIYNELIMFSVMPAVTTGFLTPGNYVWYDQFYAADLPGTSNLVGLFYPAGGPPTGAAIDRNDFKPGYDYSYPRRNLDFDELRAFYDSYDDAIIACILQNESHTWAYLKDSIMENQAKFRVVYDPTEDSTFINVYQTRVAYPDFSGPNNGNIDNLPPWWTNSFGVRDIVGIGGSGAPLLNGVIVRPSDYWTNNVINHPFFFGVTPVLSITEAADLYYTNVAGLVTNSNQTVTYSGVQFEGHGQLATSATGERSGSMSSADPSIFNFHSFMDFWPKSSLEGIDRVLISTADTVRLYKDFISTGAADPKFSALAHMYGWSTSTGSMPFKYRDSLFYVDLQDLGGRTIITLDQSYRSGQKKLDTQIKLNFGPRCVPDEGDKRAYIPNDLYLIRNTKGEYLCVPLWSTTDSISWQMPQWYEDPTQIPSYQWAVMNVRSNAEALGSPFRMVNREFEKVDIRYAYVYLNQKAPFEIAGQYSNSKFRLRGNVNGKATTVAQALKKGEITPTKDWVAKMEERFALDEYSFIRLGKTVKEDQLLGYKYIDKDSTYIDVYAFKHYNRLAGSNLRYLSWEGYEKDNSPELYAKGLDYYDKLYFNLQEMTTREIGNAAKDDPDKQGYIVLTDLSTLSGGSNVDFRSLYEQLSSKERNFTNADAVVLERFGYWEPYSVTGIDDLKPLARQAYRLFLQDYYRWHPMMKGHYVTVGEDDHYVLADQLLASTAYDKNGNSTKGLFGIPHFYFRETFFNLNNLNIGDDYFAIIQRLDTATADTDFFNWGIPKWADMKEYMTRRWGSGVANKLIRLIELNRENQLAYMEIEPTFGNADFVIRGDADVTVNISGFQLERDEDPIYRRFHVNEPNEDFAKWMKDKPDTLEFHPTNEGEKGLRLFENTGNYIDSDQSSRYGKDGGRVFNRENNGMSDIYFTDTLNNVISFLGVNNSEQYKETNRSFYLDTAYINRGTGWIKPQYLMVVDPWNPLEDDDCDPNFGWEDNPNAQYLIGRFMFNTSMYAKKVKASVQRNDTVWDTTDLLYDDKNPIWISDTKTFANGYMFRSDNFNKVEPTDYETFVDIGTPYNTNRSTLENNLSGKSYTLHTNSAASKWERFAFSWAVHIGDSLYVLKGIELEPAYQKNDVGDPKRVWETLVKEYGGGYSGTKFVDFQKLISLNTVAGADYYEAYYPLGDRSIYPIMRRYSKFKNMATVIAEGRTIGLHAVIDLSDNTHKDWVFSFRYVERGASDFVIESETAERDIRNAAVIRPGYGGWLKIQNDVPVITRPNQQEGKDIMGEAENAVWQVHRGGDRQDELPVVNDAVSAAVEVVGGAGAVTIRNATGLNVVISNILGQTIANTTLTSNNATIAAPAGVVVVAVEGEKAAKVVVK